MTDGEAMSHEQENAVKDLKDVEQQLGSIRDDITLLTDETLGNSRNREQFAKSIQGRLEAAEGKIKDVEKIVAGWKGSVDKYTTVAITAVIVGIIGFIVARVTGG